MIRRFLDCSSRHLSVETWQWLDTQFADGKLRDPANATASSIAGGKTRYGWFVYAPEDPAEMPQDLLLICIRARAQAAEYILFDCDAEPDPDLPILNPDYSETG